ncbi:MAG TPA: ribbon-helix-helix domain-containing protein [Thermoanaerobaculia bacterium]|jgi:Arc/MetJ-type ribon-helix-helix transcriptional regulator
MATKPELTTLRTEVPSRLLAEMQSLVDAGWFRSLDELMLDALRRFLDSHREDLMEKLVREDMKWGLRGPDAAQKLVEAGTASWSGGKPEGSRQKPRPRGKSASDIVLEDRR